MYRIAVSVVSCLLTISRFATAADVSVDYLKDVKPLLKAHCYGCHGGLRQESDLRLDTAGFVLRGGASGPALVRGDVSSSLLLKRVTASDISFENLYDGFSLFHVFHIEGLGFAGIKQGEALDLFQDDISINSARPVSPSGGNIGGGRTRFWHPSDAIQQIQGRAGARQIRIPAQIGAAGGMTPTSSNFIIWSATPNSFTSRCASRSRGARRAPRWRCLVTAPAGPPRGARGAPLPENLLRDLEQSGRVLVGLVQPGRIHVQVRADRIGQQIRRLRRAAKPIAVAQAVGEVSDRGFLGSHLRQLPVAMNRVS